MLIASDWFTFYTLAPLTRTHSNTKAFFSPTLRCHVRAWRDIWKNDSKTLDSRKNTHENRRTYGHCSQIYVIRGLLSDYFWQIFFIFFFLSGTFHFRDAQSLSFKTRPNTRMKLKMMIFLYRADKTFKNILHRIRKMVSFELGKQIEKEFFRLITSVGRRKKSEFP